MRRNVNPLTTTQHYFSKWLDVEVSLFNHKGIFSASSQEREKTQLGYTQPFSLYCFIKNDLAIISHTENLKDKVEAIKKELGKECSVAHLKRIIESEFNKKTTHARKYYFAQTPKGIDTSSAKQLQKTDYADFLNFHKTQYPKSNANTWLKDYFIKTSERGYIFAIYKNNAVISATDAPDVPYMADLIVEPGIATLEPFRRQGHARVVVTALIKHLVSTNKVPIWSCAFDNTGSMKLAESVGFKPFGDIISIS